MCEKSVLRGRTPRNSGVTMPTLQDVVREEAAKYKVTLTDEQVEHVIWEETGYPCFWPNPSSTPEDNFRTQIREWAKKVEYKTKPKKTRKK